MSSEKQTIDPLSEVRNQSKALEYASIVKKNLESLKSKTNNIEIPLVDIYVTDACNLRCHFCPTHFGKTFLPPEAISQIGKLSPHVITLTGGGEPSLYTFRGKKIGDVIEEIRSTIGVVPLGMMTNGTRKMEDKVLDNLAWLRVSVNGYDENSYKKVHGKDYFREVMHNIIHYLQSPMGKMGVGFVYTAQTSPFIIRFVETLLAYITTSSAADHLQKLTVQFRPAADKDYNRFRLSQQNIEHLKQQIIAANPATRRFLTTQTNIEQVLGNNCFQDGETFDKCHVSLLQMNINPNGDTYPCPQKAHAEEDCHGNILEPEFFEKLRERINKSFHGHSSLSCPQCAQNKINHEYDNIDMLSIEAAKPINPVFF